MASIALSVVGCIDYLAYGTIFTHVTFRPKIKLDVFFSGQKSPKKSPNERREVVYGIGAFPYLICVCVSQTQIEKKRLTRSRLPLKVKKLVANRKYL